MNPVLVWIPLRPSGHRSRTFASLSATGAGVCAAQLHIAGATWHGRLLSRTPFVLEQLAKFQSTVPAVDWADFQKCSGPPRIFRASWCGSRAISHSQIRKTVKPLACASEDARTSRSALRRIFSSHRSALGPVQGVLRPCSGQLCQKQPSTNTARRRPGKTKSGVQPLAICKCSRKRPPAACTARRNSTSGEVLTLRLPTRCLPFSVVTH